MDLLWLHLKDLPAFRALLRATEARFYASLPFPEPVLDLGCGDGHFGAVALPRPPDVGLDPDAHLLREARRRRAYRLLLRADGGRLPFPAGVFGTVISNCVLEHIPDVESVVREVARVLRPGGRFYFSVPGPAFLALLSVGRTLDRLGFRPLGNLYRRFFHRISRHYHYNGVDGWRARLEQAGLHLLNARPYLSPRALAAMEWGHYFGLPSWVAKQVTGRWVIWPSRWNLWLTERIVRPFYEEPPPHIGACLFLVASRDESP
ncbi:MAG: class I SAM-dependent methyltransferase [Anaerolineae bacterium]|nr:class I SAM-dependent methyltransferase [Anaerolineae bacterium]